MILLTLVFHPFGWWLATRSGAHRIGDHEASWGYILGGLGEAQAALGLILLRRLDDINRQRRENAHRMIARLQKLDFVCIPTPPKVAEPIYLRLPVLVEGTERRDHLFRRLWTARIGVGRMYQHPLPDLFPQFGDRTYPGASHLARHLLTLPTHHYLTGDDIERITHIFETTSHAR
jgi:dTDP-4-amino-4,6-dideoxygalactose transaminase